MLLIDEVELLKRVLPKIKEVGLSTPLIGDGTEERIDFIHNFMSAVLTARRICEKIDTCDPKRTMFRNIKKCFCGDYEKAGEVSKHCRKEIPVLDTLGMIIHSSYIYKDDKTVHVVNDKGECFRVSVKEFLDVLDSLCIGKNGAIWAMCKLFEEFVKDIGGKITKAIFPGEIETLLNNGVNINEEVWNETLAQVHRKVLDEYIFQDQNHFLNWLSFYCGDDGDCIEPDMELAKTILLACFPENKHRIEAGDFRKCSIMPSLKNMRFEVSVSSITESGDVELLSKSIPVGKFSSVIKKYHGKRHHCEPVLIGCCYGQCYEERGFERLSIDF